jgi:hypothetical protein
MTIQNAVNIESEAGLTPGVGLRVVQLSLSLQVRPAATRREAAARAEAYGFAWVVGGRHISVHSRDEHWYPVGPRLALITGCGPDWD